MAITLTKQELLQRAIDSIPKNLPTLAEETGIMLSTLQILGKNYHVTYCIFR